MESTSTSSYRWWDLPAASLLMVAAVTAATRLVATEWTSDLSLVQTLVFLGTIAGLAIGQSRFSPRLSAFLAIAYGIFAVPWQLGITLGRGVLWSDRLESILDRLVIIVVQLVNEEIIQDSLLFLVLMSILFWFLGVQAGYSLTRYGNGWRAILPTGLALFVIHSFDALIPRRAWFLAFYLFFGLVLIARVAYLHHHNRWQQSRTALPPHLGLDFIRFTLLATAVLVMFSWTAPALANTIPAAERAFQKIKQPYNELRDRFDNVFAGLRSSVGVVSDYYGSSVLLGRGNRLSDNQVFRVTPMGQTPESVRYYWRARTYDTYSNGQWLSTFTTSRPFNPQNGLLGAPSERGRTPIILEFASATYISTIFSAPQPLWVSRPAQAEVAANPDGSVDIAAFRATPGISPGQIYRVQSVVASATESELRAAGTNYPDWVIDRYLDLPRTITDRTRALAEQIAAGYDNPYDQAVAVTQYLRQNINYKEVIPEVPDNQEPIDWFLFDVKEGFCNYYASAEVILLRSLGIPARWSVGYAQGEFQEDGTYLVRQRDAHAWPEVYFPIIGWVEFEPTASQPLIQRLIGDPSQAGLEGLTESDEEALRRQELEELRAQREDRLLGAETPGSGEAAAQNRFYAIPIALSIVVLLFVFYRFMRLQYNWPPLPVLIERLLMRIGLKPPPALHNWAIRAEQTPLIRPNLPAFPIFMEKTLLKFGIRPPSVLRIWARRAALPPLVKAYQEINYALSRLGQHPLPNLTPSERVNALAQIIPLAQEPANRLLHEYQLATFSPQLADSLANIPAAKEAGDLIRRLSYREIFKRLVARLQKPPKPNLPGLTKQYH